MNLTIIAVLTTLGCMNKKATSDFNLTLSTLLVFCDNIAGSDINSFCIFVCIVGSDFFFL